MQLEVSDDRLSQLVTVRPDAGEHSYLSLDPDQIKSLFRQYGAVLFRGFEQDVDSFARFANRFCSHALFNRSAGRDVLDKTHRIQTVNIGQAAFDLHPELSREPWKPDVCFFGALQPPVKGGETLICDGVLLLQQLAQDVLDEISGRNVRYERPVSPEECQFWLGTENPDNDQLENPPKNCPYHFFRSSSGIMRWHLAPFLHRTMFSKEWCFGNFLLFARTNLGNHRYPLYENGTEIPNVIEHSIRAAGRKIQRAISWQQGDLLMLDNTRYLHGRNAVEDIRQRVIMSYFGYLDFAELDDPAESEALWRRPDCPEAFWNIA